MFKMTDTGLLNMSHSIDKTTDLTDLIDSRLNDYAFVQVFKNR